MSATRAPERLEPSVGLAVLIDHNGDPAHQRLAFITHVERRIARVEFHALKWQPRWFPIEDLVDARTFLTEPALRHASGISAAGHTVIIGFERLEWLVEETLVRSQVH